FVNDERAACRLVLARGIDVLEKNKLLESDAATSARAFLKDSNMRELIPTLANALMSKAFDFGVFKESLANLFSDGPADSGVANFQVFLLSMDLLLSESLKPEEVPQSREAGYVRAIRRMAALREQMRKQLESLGWKVVPVPSIAA